MEMVCDQVNKGLSLEGKKGWVDQSIKRVFMGVAVSVCKGGLQRVHLNQV